MFMIRNTPNSSRRMSATIHGMMWKSCLSPKRNNMTAISGTFCLLCGHWCITYCCVFTLLIVGSVNCLSFIWMEKDSNVFYRTSVLITMRSGLVKLKAEEYLFRAISFGNKAYKVWYVCSLISATCEAEAKSPKDNYSFTNVTKIGGLMEETDH